MTANATSVQPTSDMEQWGHVNESRPPAPHSGAVEFTAPTRRLLDWLADLGLRPATGIGQWPPPLSIDVHFGAASGWLWGTLTITATTGRLSHLKAHWIDRDGVQRLSVADGAAPIRNELERHAAERVARISWLAKRHGLTVANPAGDVCE